MNNALKIYGIITAFACIPVVVADVFVPSEMPSVFIQAALILMPGALNIVIGFLLDRLL